MSTTTEPQPGQASEQHATQLPPVLAFRTVLFAMLGIGLVNVLVALDQTVVSTALPSIVAELHGFEFYAWIASAYLLTSVVTVPVFGRLGDYFGRKPFVIAVVITFTVASVLCGLAPNMLFLALARGLQGVGGGMMVGTAFVAIPDLFPDPRAGALAGRAGGGSRHRHGRGSVARRLDEPASTGAGVRPSSSTCRSARRRCISSGRICRTCIGRAKAA